MAPAPITLIFFSSFIAKISFQIRIEDQTVSRGCSGTEVASSEIAFDSFGW